MKPPAVRASGPVVPRQASPKQRLIAWGIVAALRAAFVTQRLSLRDPHDALREVESRPVIFAIWHNRLALAPFLHRRFSRRHRPLTALISASRDGALLSAILEKFRIQPVRGSSSRRGAQAILELRARAEEGHDIAITPDGPRGPRYRVQPGVVALARLTGMPIIPVAPNARRRLDLRSWDRFQVPLPFTFVEVRVGAPLFVPPDAEPLLPFQEELGRRLTEISVD
jgi:lysophospholipid acyltransferase (LPLAT)-like uncharacterized protein